MMYNLIRRNIIFREDLICCIFEIIKMLQREKKFLLLNLKYGCEHVSIC